MKLLSSLARALVRKDFVESLRNAASADEVVALVEGVVNPAPAARRSRRRARAAAPAAAASREDHDARRGHRLPDRHRAHLHGRRLAGRRRQGSRASTLHVETQGSSGSTPLSADTIAAADAVIFATDVGVKDKGRFAGKPVIASGVKRAINEPDKMIAEAVARRKRSERRHGWRAPRRTGRRVRRVRLGRRRLGHPHPADPAHRRQLHDPVRRGGRSAHRARLPVRRLRDRQHP